jgi:hypothetical protein
MKRTRIALGVLLAIVALAVCVASGNAQPNFNPGNPGGTWTPVPGGAGGIGAYVAPSPGPSAYVVGFGDGTISGAGASGGCTPSTETGTCALDLLTRFYNSKEINYGTANTCMQKTTTSASPCNSIYSGIAIYKTYLPPAQAQYPKSTWYYLSYGTIDATVGALADPQLNVPQFEADYTIVVTYLETNVQVPADHITLATLPYNDVATTGVALNVFAYNAAVARVATHLGTNLATDYDSTAQCGSTCLASPYTLNDAGHELLATALEAPNNGYAVSAQEAHNVQGGILQNINYYAQISVPTPSPFTGGACPNVMAFSSAGHTLDPTGQTDSTAGFQYILSLFETNIAPGVPGSGASVYGGCLTLPPGYFIVGSAATPHDLTLLCSSVTNGACLTFIGSGSQQTTIAQMDPNSNLFDSCPTSGFVGAPTNQTPGYIPNLPIPVACPSSPSTANAVNGFSLSGVMLVAPNGSVPVASCTNASTCGVNPAAISLQNIGSLYLDDVVIKGFATCLDLGYSSFVSITGPGKGTAGGGGYWECPEGIAYHGAQGTRIIKNLSWKGGRSTGSGTASVFQGIFADYSDLNAPRTLQNDNTTLGNYDTVDMEGGTWGAFMFCDWQCLVGDETWTNPLVDGFTMGCYTFMAVPNYSSGIPASQHLQIINGKWITAWGNCVGLDGGFYKGGVGQARLGIDGGGLIAGSNTRDQGSSVAYIMNPQLNLPATTATISPGGFGSCGTCDASAYQVKLIAAASDPGGPWTAFRCNVYEFAPFDNPRHAMEQVTPSCNSSLSGNAAYISTTTVSGVSPGFAVPVQVVDNTAMDIGVNVTISGTTPETVPIISVYNQNCGSGCTNYFFTANLNDTHPGGATVIQNPAPPWQVGWTYTAGANTGLLEQLEYGNVLGKITQNVTGSASPQTVLVNSSLGMVPLGNLLADTVASGVQENVEITAVPDATHVTGVFLNNHLLSHPIVQNFVNGISPGPLNLSVPTVAENLDSYVVYTSGNVVPMPQPTTTGYGLGTSPYPYQTPGVSSPCGTAPVQLTNALASIGSTSPIYCYVGQMTYGAAVRMTNDARGLALSNEQLNSSNGACLNVDAPLGDYSKATGRAMQIVGNKMGVGCAFGANFPVPTAAPTDYSMIANDFGNAGTGTFVPTTTIVNFPPAVISNGPVPQAGQQQLVPTIAANRGAFPFNQAQPTGSAVINASMSGTVPFFNLSPYTCQVYAYPSTSPHPATITQTSVNGVVLGELPILTVTLPPLGSVTYSFTGDGLENITLTELCNG